MGDTQPLINNVQSFSRSRTVSSLSRRVSVSVSLSHSLALYYPCMCVRVCVCVCALNLHPHLSVLSYSKRPPRIREPVNFTCFIEYILSMIVAPNRALVDRVVLYFSTLGSRPVQSSSVSQTQITPKQSNAAFSDHQAQFALFHPTANTHIPADFMILLILIPSHVHELAEDTAAKCSCR